MKLFRDYNLTYKEAKQAAFNSIRHSFIKARGSMPWASPLADWRMVQRGRRFVPVAPAAQRCYAQRRI